MYFGAPSGVSKWYYGRGDDTPWNQDLNWRLRVTWENKRLREEEGIRGEKAARRAELKSHQLARRVWDSRDSELLRDAIRLHGVGAWDVIAASKRYERLWCYNTQELRAKWKMLEKSRGISMKNVSSSIPLQKSISLPSLERKRILATNGIRSHTNSKNLEVPSENKPTETSRLRKELSGERKRRLEAQRLLSNERMNRTVAEERLRMFDTGLEPPQSTGSNYSPIERRSFAGDQSFKDDMSVYSRADSIAPSLGRRSQTSIGRRSRGFDGEEGMDESAGGGRARSRQEMRARLDDMLNSARSKQGGGKAY